MLSDAMSGANAVILTLPLIFDSEDVTKITNSVITANKKSSIKKLIFNTSIALGKRKTGYAAIDVKHDALTLLKNQG